jgi:tetratricopeptide (TPR) repeat protein
MNLFLSLLFLLTPAPQQDSQDAWALFRSRDYVRALERFENKEANLYPDWEVVHDAMGWCHYFLEDYSAAELKFKKALELNSNYKWSLEGLQALADLKAAPLQQAQELLDSGSYSEARVAFQRIQEGVTIAPSAAKVPAMIGEAWSLHGLGRYKEAKTQFRAALKKKRGDGECYFGIGYCDYALLDYRNAAASLELGLKASPGDFTAQLTIAWSYYWRQKYDKSLAAFDKAGTMNRAGYGAWAGRGWSLYQMKDKAGALHAFETAVRMSPYAFSTELRQVAETEVGWQSLSRLVAWSALRQQLNSWAQTEFETLLARNPADADAQAGLAFTHFRQGSYELALEQIIKLRSRSDQLGPWNFPVLLDDGSTIDVAMNLLSLQSWCSLRRGNTVDALDGFRQARRGNPEWVDAACGEGWTLYAQGDYAGAEVVFAAAEILQASYPDATSGTAAVQSWRYQQYSDAWNLLYAGSNAAARNSFEALLKQDGHRFPKERNHLLHASIAWTWMNENKWKLAEQSFERSIQLAPASGLGLRGFAKLRMKQQKWEQAEAKYKEALKTGSVSDAAEAHAELGWCHLRQTEFLAARNAFETAQELDQNCATALAGMATLLLEREQVVEARVTWERALSLDPTLADQWNLAAQIDEHEELEKLHSALGWAWYYRSIYSAAEAQFQLARNKDPNEYTVLRGLGMLMLETNRVPQGAEYLVQYLERSPESEGPWGIWSSTRSSLAWALYGQGQFKESLKHFRALAELHRGQKTRYADPFDGAGWCLFKQGKYATARKEFLKAIEITPRHESSLLGLEAVAGADQ